MPLAIRHPRAQPFASDVLASQVDILPTLLALCGEPAFEGLQGRDLSLLLLGQKADRPESVFAEGKIGQKEEWRMLVLASDHYDPGSYIRNYSEFRALVKAPQ